MAHQGRAVSKILGSSIVWNHHLGRNELESKVDMTYLSPAHALLLRVLDKIAASVSFGKILDEMIGKMLGEFDASMVLLAEGWTRAKDARGLSRVLMSASVIGLLGAPPVLSYCSRAIARRMLTFPKI